MSQPKRLEFEDFAKNVRRVFADMREHDGAILVVRGSDIYRIVRETGPSDIFAAYDGARAEKAVRASAGALTGVDRDRLLGDLAAEREQESTGRS